MARHSKQSQLDYLCEYPLGEPKRREQRKVPLRQGDVRDFARREEACDLDNFGWKLARRLEGREQVAESEGVWPINCWRSERRIGLPGIDIFRREVPLTSATESVFSAAREMRRLCYFRVADSSEAIRVLQCNQKVRYASEITTEWYDPPAGVIVVPSDGAQVIGSHQVPIAEFDNSHGRFIFQNSWGIEWGFRSLGTIPTEHFDRFILEAWVTGPLGRFVPFESTSGIVCLEWKWSVNDSIGVHCREIIDAATSERIAWAFCTKRHGFLDVEEFFVWPSERGKGYGRQLATMTKALAASMGLPLRLLASFADTEPENQGNLDAAARMLGVEFTETQQRWVHCIGTANPCRGRSTRKRPQRPAFMLERLRPKDEKPISTPIEYGVVFGTNRRPTRIDEKCIEFGADRDEVLHTGVSRVTIPATHQFGCKGRAWFKFWNWLTGNNPRILERRLFQRESDLREWLLPIQNVVGDAKYNLLFVHGYNVSFDDAMTQAASIAVDLKVPGATFAFSWASAGRINSYMADEAAIESSITHLKEFIATVLRATDNTPLNVIVHSMGNRAVLRVLDAIAQGDMEYAQGRIKNVVFAAPDVDTMVFREIVTRILPVSARTTLYAARGDIALQASEWLHEFPRAGLAPPVVTIDGLDTILVEGFNLLDLGHSYFAEASSVLHDLYVLLSFTSEPRARPALIEATTEQGGSYWKLPRQQ
ncbi:MAG: alpha/beta hydrolase [Pirellulales bacterium]